MSLFTPFSFIQAPSGGGGDADADAFIAAAGITDPTQQSAIQTLVTTFKADGIWTKLQAFYPFVGGTASSHKWNLKDPRDLDAAYRLVFGPVTSHSANGFINGGNVGNSYADTFYEIGVDNTQNDFMFGLYVYSNTLENRHDFGYYNGTDDNLLALTFTSRAYANTKTFSYISVANTDSRGMWNASFNSEATLRFYHDGTEIANGSQSMPTNASGNHMVIGASDRRSLGAGITENSSKTYACAWLGEGLSASQNSDFYDAVQAYNTTLSRNV